MKKISMMLLSIALIFTSSVYSFAANAKDEIIKVNLEMTTSEDDLEFIKTHTEEDERLLSSDNNTFAMNVTEVEADGENILLSGNVAAKVFGKMQLFSFEDQNMDIKCVNGVSLYSGIIEAAVDETHTALLDLTATKDFKKVIASLTIVNSENDKQQIMLYGDTFAEQAQLYRQEYAAVQAMQKEEEILASAAMETKDKNQTVDETSTVQAKAGKSKYQHVTNKSNSTLGGVSRDKQMMVMNVSKCDPVNFGSGNTGYEHIRIFTRSYNLPKVDTTILLAKPARATVKFSGSSEIMSVIATTPDAGSNAIENLFQIFASIAGNSGNSMLANAALIVSVLPGNTVTKSGNTATFKPTLSGLSGVDLPAKTNSSDAETNTDNGVAFVVAYIQHGDVHSGTVTCSSSISYQVFLNTDRTAVMQTGTATVSHNVNLN